MTTIEEPGSARADPFLDVNTFVTVVEAGSFTAAAERLRVTRSAVSKSVGRLERELDQRLFHRSTRKQSLTEAGEQFYDSSRKAREALQGARRRLDTGRREVGGRLRVSVPVLFGRVCVAPVLSSLLREHPALRLEMSFNDRIVDLALDGFDMAVRSGALRDSSELVARRLTPQQMMLCAAPRYLARQPAPRTPDDLAAHATIIYGHPSGRTRDWAFPQPDGRHWTFTPKHPQLRLDDAQAVADAALAGYGVAWLPCWLIRPHVRSGALVPLLPEQGKLAIECHAVWLRDSGTPPRVRAAVDTLVHALPELMG